MPAAPVGAVVTLAPYDWGISRHKKEPPPEAGDYLLTEGSTGYGTAYLIQNARLMARSAVPGRYSLRCVKLGGPSVIPEGARVLVIRWYPRNARRRPRLFPGPHDRDGGGVSMLLGFLKPRKRRKASAVKKAITAARLGAKAGVKLASGKQERKER